MSSKTLLSDHAAKGTYSGMSWFINSWFSKKKKTYLCTSVLIKLSRTEYLGMHEEHLGLIEENHFGYNIRLVWSLLTKSRFEFVRCMNSPSS